MNATKNHIGENQNFRKSKTKATAQTIGRVRSLASKTKNSQRNTERQTEICSDSNASNGFLKCRFLPKIEETETLQYDKKTTKMEKDFYKSLFNFAGHFHIEPMQSKDFGFPYNLALAMWDMETKMKQINENWNDY